jgi:hypothetical protein
MLYHLSHSPALVNLLLSDLLYRAPSQSIFFLVEGKGMIFLLSAAVRNCCDHQVSRSPQHKRIINQQTGEFSWNLNPRLLSPGCFYYMIPFSKYQELFLETRASETITRS